MNDYLNPDHWVNGGEYDFCDPIAKAFTELELENKRLRVALEHIRDTPFVIYEPVRQIAVEALNER